MIINDYFTDTLSTRTDGQIDHVAWLSLLEKDLISKYLTSNIISLPRLTAQPELFLEDQVSLLLFDCALDTITCFIVDSVNFYGHLTVVSVGPGFGLIY